MPIMASLAELIGSSSTYSANYGWFVDLARNFHTIQERGDTVSLVKYSSYTVPLPLPPL